MFYGRLCPWDGCEKAVKKELRGRAFVVMVGANQITDEIRDRMWEIRRVVGLLRRHTVMLI